jgi:hypothetical protein
MPTASNAKQHIYQRMLMKVTDYRSLAALECLGGQEREWLKELALQADLLHGIPRAIVTPEITDDDVTFLNRQARYYLSVAQPGWVNHRFFKLMIYQLFILISSQRRSELQWPGPSLDEEERRMIGPESD